LRFGTAAQALIGANLEIVGGDVVRRAFPEARLVLELGHYIIGEAGVYVTRILDRKVSRGQVFSSSTEGCTISSPRRATSVR
jgi:diaminopimelate decarboxylase